MSEKYEVASVKLQDMPLVPGSNAARKAILKHEINEDDLIDRYYDWLRETQNVVRQDTTDYSFFLNRMVKAFLTRTEKENQVLSPLSIFHALTVMVELTEGDTQREILSVLGLSDADSAETAMNLSYRANLASGGAEVRPFAMLWFDESVNLNQHKMQEIANTIYAGSCQGKMIDSDYQNAISSWLNTATGSTLPVESRTLKVDAKTKLILLTTIYFHDKWENEFERRKTKAAIFHTQEGDVRVPFMRQSCWLNVCINDSYTAVPLDFEGGDSLWFILPKEGYSPEDLLREDFFTSFPPDWQHKVKRDVHMEIPKFDIHEDFELLETLQAMGIQRLFGDNSQTPYTVTEDGLNIKIDQAKHSAKLKIDERGCEAAAYTIMMGIAAAGIPETPPRMDFILNRPFLFALTGKGNLPLFMGIVRQPETAGI